jgi:hypothetical protein
LCHDARAPGWARADQEVDQPPDGVRGTDPDVGTTGAAGSDVRTAGA